MAVCPNLGLGQLRADFSVSGGTGCLPLAVKFNDLSTGNPDRWVWDAGDGRISTLREPSFLYLEPGEFTVKLTIYKGATDSSVLEKVAVVKVYQFPVVDFVADISEGCAPLRVTLTSRSVPGSGTIKRSLWDFGDGSGAEGNTVPHTYTNSGSFNVALTIENEFGCSRSLSIPNLIEIYPTVQAGFGFRASNSCKGPFTVSFSDSSAGIGVSSFTWTFGDGASSTVRNPTHVFQNQGTYNVRLIATNTQGCSDTVTRQVTVSSAAITADFTMPDTVCRNQSIVAINNSRPVLGVDSVKWIIGNGQISTQLNPLFTFADAGLVTIRLVAFSGLCSDTMSKTLFVKNGPDIDFSSNVNGSCAPPLTVNFTSNVANGTVLRWNLGNGSRPTASNPSTTYTRAGNFSVTLVAISPNGCIDSITRPSFIRIVPPAITNIPPLLYEGCFPYTARLRPRVNTFTPITRWEWDFGDGRTSTDSFPTVTYTTRGEYRVKLKVFTANGCVDSVSSIIKGGLKPVFDFSANPLIVCPEDLVTFNDTISQSFEWLQWQFGDGGTSPSQDPSYIYKDTGFMTVRLIVSDFGCTDTLTKADYIYVSPPIARFSAPFNCDSPFVRRFTDNSISPQTWHWNFGNGDTSILQHPVVTYKDTGRYTVTLTVTNGDCIHRTSQPIRILNEKPDFEFMLIQGCYETTGRFVARGDSLQHANIARYEWFLGNRPVISTADSVVNVLFNTNESLTVRLRITDLNGCSSEISKNLTVRINGSRPEIKPPFRFACINQELSIDDSTNVSGTSPIRFWRLNFGDGTIQTFNTPQFRHTYRDTGLFDLTLTIEDENGCIDSVRQNGAIRVLAPVARFSSPDSIICENAPVRMTNLSTGVGLRYRWSFGQGDSSILPAPITRYDSNGFYTILLVITDTAGCQSSFTRSAYINVGGVKANFEMSDSVASCPPLRVLFTNNSAGANRYVWNFGNGNSSILTSPVQTYTLAGTYNVKLFIEGNGNCVDSIVKKVIIRGPQGELSYGPLSGCPPLRVSFKSTANNVQRFIWDYSDGQTNITTDSFSTHAYLNPGNYRPRVILEDGDNCRIPIIGRDVVRVIGVRSLIQTLPSYTFCDSARIQFTDSSLTNGNIIRWNWDFGDGGTSSIPNPVHFFNKPGRYSVKLTVQTADSCQSVVFLQQQIIIAQSPKLSLADSLSLCLPATLRLQPQWTNPDTSRLTINWDFSLGNNGSSLIVPPISIADTGNYRFNIRISNNYGCTSNYTTNIKVTEVAEILFGSLNSTLFCDSGFVRFSQNITATAPVRSLTWDFGDGNTGTGSNPGHWYRRPGLYRVKLRVDATNGCFTQREIPAQIRVAPSPLINPLSDTAFCVPGRAFMRASLTGADTIPTTWQWNFANGSGAMVQNPGWLSMNVPGTYNTWVATRNSFGCTDTVFRQVIAHDTPVVRAGPSAPV
ncbi:MAG: PKD domain-containing protein, partial [Chitinophagaceae bacterium]|nr:PKD domain-containing protein [Chitinophagaceae bacterium]